MNCYLVREEDGFTLVDAGLPGGAKDILQACGEGGRADLKRILLTHGHGDHVGAVDALMTDATRAGTGDFGSRCDGCCGRICRSMPGEPQTKIKGSTPGIRRRCQGRFVTEGELYGSLRCVATPGHTPGHFSFLDERDGTLLAGDALVTVGGESADERRTRRGTSRCQRWRRGTSRRLWRAWHGWRSCRLRGWHRGMGRVLETSARRQMTAVVDAAKLDGLKRKG